MFYISPFFRARMTFEQIASHLNPVAYKWTENPRLREQEWGHYKTPEQCRQIETDRDKYGTFYYRIPDGESGAVVFDRVSDFMHTLYRDFEKADYPRNTVLITHGLTIRLFLMKWFHWTVEEFEVLANPENCQIIVMKVRSEKYVLDSEMTKRTVINPNRRPVKLTKYEEQ